MKATGTIIGRLMVGCVFACCLTLKLYAQIPPLPPPDTNDYDGGTNMPIDLGAIQAADYSNNYAPWIIQDIVIPGGSQQTGFAMQTQTTSDLLTLSTNITAMQADQHAASAICSSVRKFRFRKHGLIPTVIHIFSTTLTTMVARVSKSHSTSNQPNSGCAKTLAEEVRVLV